MPNLITHTLFCDDVLAALDNSMLNEHRMLFITGGQGPDFLFYHHSDPLRSAWKKSEIRRYGNKLHSAHINDFYLSALNSIAAEDDEAIRDDMTSYVCGHLCHWALDSTVHPLVYYRTGDCRKLSAGRHHRYEALLDAALLKYYRNMTIEDYDPSKECFSSDLPTARTIARIYVPALRDLYGADIRPNAIAQALKDWKHLQREFRDPKGHKKKIFGAIEKVTGTPHLLTGFSVPHKVEDNIDVCNLLHSTWKHPATGEDHTESVFDLLKIALEKATEAIELFLSAVHHSGNEEKKQNLIDFLGDANYEMGLPGSPVPVYFDLVDLSR